MRTCLCWWWTAVRRVISNNIRNKMRRKWTVVMNKISFLRKGSGGGINIIKLIIEVCFVHALLVLWPLYFAATICRNSIAHSLISVPTSLSPDILVILMITPVCTRLYSCHLSTRIDKNQIQLKLPISGTSEGPNKRVPLSNVPLMISEVGSKNANEQE